MGSKMRQLPSQVWVGVLALALAGAAFASPADYTPAASDQAAGLPDLDQVAPWKLDVSVVMGKGAPRYRLGFRSGLHNLGTAPLAVVAVRRSGDKTMTAKQVLAAADGSAGSGRPVGRLRFVSEETHRHWHLLDFIRYELRDPDGFELVARDRKSGFCLSDRFRTGEGAAALVPRKPVFAFDCGRDRPDLLRVRQGISVGWGDVYERFREGQFIDVTDVPAGVYYLVHRVNPVRKIRERNYENNAASVLVQLSWPRTRGQKPLVRILARCDDSARCPAAEAAR
jgi:Lysyl oxidase